MATRSGIAGQFGYKAESSWGTGVTVDRFLPFKSESMTANKARLDSDSIYAGRLVRDSEQWDAGAIEAGGEITLDVFTTGEGLLWKHALGSVNTTGSGPYAHAFTPGNLDGLGLTIQIGKPDRGGTVRPWNFVGCKVRDWELTVPAKEAASLKVGFSAKDLDKDGTPALQSWSPPAALARFTWAHATVASIHGSSPKIKSLSIKGVNGIETDRYFLGSDKIDEQDEVDLRAYTAEAEIEFASETIFDAFWDGTEADLALTLTRGSASLAIAGNCRLDGDGASPVVENRGKLTQKIPAVFVGDDSDADAMTITYTTSDSTP